MSLHNFEIVTTRTGAISIRDKLTQEIMHNPVGPWEEANSLYIQQSNLAQKLSHPEAREFVIFDVGLGAAANSLAILHCARSVPARRPLKIVSFERDLSLLQFALNHADQFPHFAGYESAVQAILNTGLWEQKADESGPGAAIRWELRHGDFTSRIARERANADLVYFDPYSPLKNPDMWSPETFKNLFDRCNQVEGQGCLLLTYSRATPVRVSMLLAGFYVGVGISSGLKDETTQASTRLEDLSTPLDKSWFSRWEKSSKPYSAGTNPEQKEAIQDFMVKHPQFN